MSKCFKCNRGGPNAVDLYAPVRCCKLHMSDANDDVVKWRVLHEKALKQQGSDAELLKSKIVIDGLRDEITMLKVQVASLQIDLDDKNVICTEQRTELLEIHRKYIALLEGALEKC